MAGKVGGGGSAVEEAVEVAAADVRILLSQSKFDQSHLGWEHKAAVHVHARTDMKDGFDGQFKGRCCAARQSEGDDFHGSFMIER